MKKLILLIIAVLCIYTSYAQVPEMFNYQAVVRNDQGEILSEQDVQFQLSILVGSAEGESVYSESHMVSTNAVGIVDLVIGMGSGPDGSLGAIDWGSSPHFLKVELDPKGGTSFNHMGTTQLISVPYAMVSGAVQPMNKFTVVAEEGHAVDEALFEVKDELGNTLFAVYPEGTRVYVDDSEGKGIKGGFAVGGYKKAGKGETNEYFRVTPDSVRIYIEEPEGKGIKGGFAVGGYKKAGKGEVTPHFFVSVDSTEVYVNDPLNGGFNVKLNDPANKGNTNEIMSVTTANSFIGWEAGYANTIGQDNTFIGTRAGYYNDHGRNNIYLGYEAGVQNITGNNNIYIGYKAGSSESGGDNRLFIENDVNDLNGALIYGEFDNDRVRINSKLGIGRNADEFNLEIEGSAYKTDSDVWSATSDSRVKTNIRNISDACSQIMKLRPVTFEYSEYWKSVHPGVKDKIYYNFIAQEFKEVFPEAVTKGSETIAGDDEGLYTMSNQPAIIVAIKAVQELVVENREQQLLIEELQEENDEMEALKERIEKLEGMLSVEH